MRVGCINSARRSEGIANGNFAEIGFPQKENWPEPLF